MYSGLPKVRPQHPGHLFMLFHEADEKIIGSHVAMFATDQLEVRP
jgi:hypothetical protein